MPASTGDRAREFARLLNFFDHLTTRGKKHHSAQTPNDTIGLSPSIVHSGVRDTPTTLQHISNVTEFRDLYHTTVSYDPPIASRLEGATGHSVSEDGEGEEQTAQTIFPMEKQHPFTFKLMLHKLYGREDWLKKVQEALEQSKKDYKPLSESLKDRGTRNGKSAIDGDGGKTHGAARSKGEGVDFALNRERGQAGRTDLAQGRQRSLSATTPPILEDVVSAATHRGTARAVKKRCVGRRKSLSGPVNVSAEIGVSSIPWIYDAMIAQVENEVYNAEGGSLRGKGRRRTVSAAYEGTNVVGDAEGRRVRKRTLTMVPNTILENVEKPP